MKKTMLGFGLSIILIASVAFAATDRTRSGGIAVIQADRSLVLMAEGSQIVFEEYSYRATSTKGSVRVLARGSQVFAFFKMIYAKYSQQAPDQVRNTLERQIIYAAGVTCVRRPVSTPGSAPKDYFDLRETDEYWCEFVMDLHSGQSRATGVPEPRGRFGVSNGGSN